MAKGRKESSSVSIVLLLLLLIVVIVATIYWFNFIGLLNIQRSLFKAYQKIPGLKVAKEIQDPLLLDKEYLDKYKLSLDNRNLTLDNKQKEQEKKELEIANKENELKKKEDALAQKEENINALLNQYDNIKENIRSQAQDFINMPPESAVSILNNMDIYIVVDILRTINEIAAESGESSIVPYYLSLMPPDRAAQIQELLSAGASTLPHD